MPEPSALRFRYVGRIIVGVHTAHNPSPEEWRGYCELNERVRHELRGVLIYSDGGGPDTAQRQQIRLALQDTPMPPSAIVTGSPVVRGIMTSLNWYLGNRLAAFEPGDIEGALQYLARGQEAFPHDEVVQVLGVLATQLDVRLPLARLLTQREAQRGERVD